MSLRAIIWAFDQFVPSSPRKFVLVALANYANDSGKSYPGIESISSITGQNRKTVMRALSKLVADGFIQDTGERSGSTGKIVVYQFPNPAIQKIPKAVSFDFPSSPPMVQKQSLNGPSMVPKTEIAIYKEPLTGNREQGTVMDQCEAIFQCYPKKVGKKQALIEIEKALSRVPFDDLISKTKEYASSVPKDKVNFCKDPERWFKYDRWNDPIKVSDSGPKTNDHTNGFFHGFDQNGQRVTQ